MVVTWDEITLGGRRDLIFGDGTVATLDLALEVPSEDTIYLTFQSGVRHSLRGVVDRSYSLDANRVFAFKGSDLHRVLLFGGEIAYYVRSDGRILDGLITFRQGQDIGAWKTEVLPYEDIVIIAYEAAILAIEESLWPRWLRRKYYDDQFAGVNEDKVVVRRDLREPWFIRISDGQVQGSRTGDRPIDLPAEPGVYWLRE